MEIYALQMGFFKPQNLRSSKYNKTKTIQILVGRYLLVKQKFNTSKWMVINVPMGG